MRMTIDSSTRQRLRVGDHFLVRQPERAQRSQGIQSSDLPCEARSAVGNGLVSEAALDALVPATVRTSTHSSIRKAGTTDAEYRLLCERTLKPFPDADVLTPAGRLGRQTGQRGQRAGSTSLYVLLALAIVISLFGIANTLALSIHERTARARDAAGDRHDAAPGADA